MLQLSKTDLWNLKNISLTQLAPGLWLNNKIKSVHFSYEIQVEAHSRSCGLGRQIMETLDKIVKEANLAMVVLTVFKFNLTSIEFFKSLG